MLKNQRHYEILEILKKESFAEVRTLSQRLYASHPTIRRDLDYLEKQGYVKRSHGGAILADDKINTPISFRKGTKAREKAQICKLASTLIKPGSLIFTDASTTASHLADYIQPKDNITVVSNGYNICRSLAENDIRIFSTGGKLMKSSMAFVGKQAEESVKSFNADYLFFSSSSIDENGAISDYSEEERSLRVAMYERSAKSVFLCDSSKFDKTSAFREFTLSDIDYIITDAFIKEDILNKYKLILTVSHDGVCMYEHNKKCDA